MRCAHLRRTPECQRAGCARKRSGVDVSGVATVSTGACSEAVGSGQGGASVGVAASARGGVIHSEAACLSIGCPTLEASARGGVTQLEAGFFFKVACLLIGCSALGTTVLQSRVKNEAP